MSVLQHLTFLNFLAVGVGAAVGAWVRWGLGLLLNPWMHSIPLGTLVANVLGGYLIGLALAAFHLNTHWPLVWKLLLVTGFLGGLTTFSTFSAEVMTRVMAGQWLLALGLANLHVLGSLLATYLGFWTLSGR